MKLIEIIMVTLFVLLGLGSCVAGLTVILDDMSKPIEWYYMLGNVVVVFFINYIACMLAYLYFIYIKNKFKQNGNNS